MNLRERLLNLLDRAVSGDTATLPRAAKRTREVLNQIAPGSGDRLPRGSVPALIAANQVLTELVTGESGPAPTPPAAPPAPAPSPAQTPARLTYNTPPPGTGPKAMLENFERSLGLRRQTAEVKPASQGIDTPTLRKLAETIFGGPAVAQVLTKPIESDRKLWGSKLARAAHGTWEMEQLRSELARRPGPTKEEIAAAEAWERRQLARLFYTAHLSVPRLSYSEFNFEPAGPCSLGPRQQALAARWIGEFFEAGKNPEAAVFKGRVAQAGREWASEHPEAFKMQ